MTLMQKLKIKAWPKLLLPSLLGQSLGVYLSSNFLIEAFFFGMIISVLDLFYILFLNDVADEAVDCVKEKVDPHKKFNPLVTGNLKTNSLLLRGVACALMIFTLSYVASASLTRPWSLVFSSLMLLTFQAYSFYPIRLNYRGGGELLESFGLAVLLPWFNAYLQSNILFHPSYITFLPIFFFCLCGAIASGLSDEKSDRIGGKKTLAVILGQNSAYLVILFCLFLSILSLIFMPMLQKNYYVLPFKAVLFFITYQSYQKLKRTKKNKILKHGERINGYKKNLQSLIKKSIFITSSYYALLGALL